MQHVSHYFHKAEATLKGCTVARKEWLIVMRIAKETHSRGIIVKQFSEKKLATDYLAWIRENMTPETESKYQSWVIPKEDWLTTH